MPLKLTAGVSRKLGLPGYSSVGAICHVELELDSDCSRRRPTPFAARSASVRPVPQSVNEASPLTSPLTTKRVGREVPAEDSPRPTVLALPTATATRRLASPPQR